jgi:hypothetical protein
VYFLTLLSHAESEGIPIFQFSNTGYAQFRYNSSSRQWAVLGFNSQIKLPLADGIYPWKSD